MKHTEALANYAARERGRFGRVAQSRLPVTRRRRQTQKGQALVETALVFTVGMAMVLFVLDMGRLMLMQQFITERARTTARAAAVNNWDATAAANYLVYNSTTAPAQSGQGTPGGLLGLMPSQVTYSTLGIAGAADRRVQIRVTGVPLISFIPYMAGSFSAPPIVATAPAQSLGATN